MKPRPGLLLLAAAIALISTPGFAQKQAALQQGQSQSPAQGANANAQNEDDVREAVFRYQFKAVRVQVSFRFVSVDNKNPAQPFLDRFRDDQPPVRPAGDAHYEKKPIPGYVDKKTSKQGILFKQGAIHWTSATEADVEGSYECGELCDPTNGVYHVAHTADGWNVSSFEAAKPRS